VTSREFRDRLIRRARRAKIAVAPETADVLEEYFRLLDRWNAKINLTALPLRPPTDETFDRLFVEPLAAARFLPNEPDVWLDLGSGGGSPAIPLKAVRPKLKLTMVESKVRKAAFLREAVRTPRHLRRAERARRARRQRLRHGRAEARPSDGRISFLGYLSGLILFHCASSSHCTCPSSNNTLSPNVP